MFQSLLNCEWVFISQMIYRINQCNSYDEFSTTVLSNLKGLIHFSKGISFQAVRESGKNVLKNPKGLNILNEPTNEDFYLERKYNPKWTDYFSAPWSNVFCYSEISTADEWENSLIYREVLKPQNLYYGLYTTLVYNDNALGAFVLWRSKEEGDYSQRDLYIMDSLKNHLALKMAMLASDPHSCTDYQKSQDQLAAFSNHFRLTKRETEILHYIVSGKSNEEICQLAFISLSTLKKHVCNIYKKTNVHNTTKLIKLFHEA